MGLHEKKNKKPVLTFYRTTTTTTKQTTEGNEGHSGWKYQIPPILSGPKLGLNLVFLLSPSISAA